MQSQFAGKRDSSLVLFQKKPVSRFLSKTYKHRKLVRLHQHVHRTCQNIKNKSTTELQKESSFYRIFILDFHNLGLMNKKSRTLKIRLCFWDIPFCCSWSILLCLRCFCSWVRKARESERSTSLGEEQNHKKEVAQEAEAQQRGNTTGNRGKGRQRLREEGRGWERKQKHRKKRNMWGHLRTRIKVCTEPDATSSRRTCTDRCRHVWRYVCHVPHKWRRDFRWRV